MLDPGIPVPTTGRTFSSTCRVRLADVDRHGRVRLDALARFLQDVAIEDVQETGWGMPEHLWFLRRIRIDVVEPFLEDERVDLVTWSSGQAAIAAGRRWSLRGDRGGRAEVDSVWIHLDRDQRPARIEAFEIYGDAAGGRRVSTKLELPDPPRGRSRPPVAAACERHRPPRPRQQRRLLAGRRARASRRSASTPARPLVAELDYREPIDLDDGIELVATEEGGSLVVGLRAPDGIRAVARVRLDSVAPGCALCRL